jgi:hypothetical protein
MTITHTLPEATGLAYPHPAAASGTQPPAGASLKSAPRKCTPLLDPTPEANVLPDNPRTSASGTTSTGHGLSDAQRTFAGGPNFPQARDDATPNEALPAGTQLTDGQVIRDAHAPLAVGDPTSSSDQTRSDAQNPRVTAGSTSAAGQVTLEPQTDHACGGFLRDPVLGVLADVLDDLEKVRIANANRVRILTRNEADGDGEERGHGLTEQHPQVKALILTVKALEAAEHDAVLNLQRSMRKHPLAAFQKRHKGIGEKQLARLLAVIGDPYFNDLHQRPRTVSELWAYAGFHVIHTSSGHPTFGTHPDHAAGTQPHSRSRTTTEAHNNDAAGVAPKRTRGQRSNWSEDARKRVWVIASAMPKFPGGQYEQTYRDARIKYAESVHTTPCVRCGPKGKPAPEGSPLSDGHKHARAVRITAKAILRDLWIEARDIHQAGEA